MGENLIPPFKWGEPNIPRVGEYIVTPIIHSKQLIILISSFPLQFHYTFRLTHAPPHSAFSQCLFILSLLKTQEYEIPSNCLCTYNNLKCSSQLNCRHVFPTHLFNNFKVTTQFSSNRSRFSSSLQPYFFLSIISFPQIFHVPNHCSNTVSFPAPPHWLHSKAHSFSLIVGQSNALFFL